MKNRLLLLTLMIWVSVAVKAQLPLGVTLSVANPPATNPCTGTVVANVDNGFGDVFYTWSNGATNVPSIYNLCAGTYCVTIYDPGTCTENGNCTASSCVNVSVIPAAPPCPIVSNASNFNGTAIASGDYIWFNGVFKINGSINSAVTLNVSNQTITFGGVTVSVPNSTITVSPSATTATTTFNGSEWVSTFPVNTAGNDFLAAVAYKVPAGGIPGGINSVVWNASFTSSQSNLNVNWQWGAAVYTSFNSNLASVGVKPCDDNHASTYQNSDHAGTPENYTHYVTGGARGGGGSNYTGSYSGTVSPEPCLISNPIESGSKKQNDDNTTGINTTAANSFSAHIYPNPSSNQFFLHIEGTNEVETSIMVYDIAGKLIENRSESITGSDITFGQRYSTGAYIVKITQGDNTSVMKVIKTE